MFEVNQDVLLTVVKGGEWRRIARFAGVVNLGVIHDNMN